MNSHLSAALVAILLCSVALTHAQPDGPPSGRPPGFAPGGRGFGGPGPMREELEVVKKFDKDGDKRLDAAERKAAREFVVQERANNRGDRRGPRRGPGEEDATATTPGPKMAPADVTSYPGAPLYATNVVRTLFLNFESADWEKELSDFHNTDVEVPAKLTVDGKTYRDVGVHFRGASSYMMVGEGRKRSLNLSLDYALKDQNLLGYRTLNLLNSHGDPSFLRAVLYSQVARAYIPAPRANFVRVVINGEYWGVYVNVEQFNKDFIQHFFGSTKGARWKVPGSPRGEGSLAFLGEDPAAYKRIYDIKSKDDPKSWADLIKLCKVLNQVGSNNLVQALSPLLDIDGALKFLAIENALVNNDGYWVRTSDYNLYQDEKGRFHLIPHDTNETFSKPGGPGFGGRGGPGGPGRPERSAPGSEAAAPAQGEGARPGLDNRRPGVGGQIAGVELDPLYGADDPSKPLISKLLAVPELRARYLGYVRQVAQQWLDWNKLGPIATNYHILIAADVKLDTRKLSSDEQFEKSLTEDVQGRGFGPGGGTKLALKNFADQRREYLLRVSKTP